MANYRYFNALTELVKCYPIDAKEFAERFPDEKVGAKHGSYPLIGRPDVPITENMKRADVDALYVPVERVIEYKKNPSLHKCDARCQNATGRIMKCECRCGGRFHGVGFSAEEVE